MTRSFVIPAAGNGSPDSVSRKIRLAEAMLAQSMGAEPISSPLQGAAKLAQALMGGLAGMRADSTEQKGRAGAQEALVKALQGGRGVAPSQSDPRGDLAAAMTDPWQSEMGNRMAYDQWQQMNQPPPKPEYREVGGRLVEIGPNGVKEAYVPPQAPPDPMKDLQMQKAQLEIEQMRNPQPNPAIENPMQISKDFQNQEGMSRIKTIAPTLESMYQSLSDPSAMADMDFIYGLVKILDPTSVVRESETGMVINSQGIGPQLLGTLNKIASGDQAMMPHIRQKLFGVAWRRAQELKQQAETERGFFSKMATANQHDPETYLQQVPGLPKWQEQNMRQPGTAQPMAPAPVQGGPGQTTTAPGKTSQPWAAEIWSLDADGNPVRVK